ncbi:MAG: hypothetical protein WKF91_14765, partial [Segetibacter sp.]
INNALYHVSRDPSNNNQWAFIAGDRLSTNGTSYIDFEFLQGSVIKNADGTFTGNPATGKPSGGGRTQDDLIISMEYTNGGSKPNVFIYQWKLSGNVWSYQLASIPNLASNVFAETNRTAAETNLPYTAFAVNTYQQFAFVEAAVNITYLISQTSSGNACASLSIKTLWIKTKASASSTAALKDFVEPIPVNLNFGQSQITPIGPFCVDNTTPQTLAATPAGGTFSGPGVSNNQFTPSAAGVGTHTINYNFSGCSATTTVTVNAIPGAPTIGVVDNCDGSSDLTASNFTGALLWSNGATTSSIHVTSAGTYTVTQTVNGCTSPAGSGTAAPKTTPGAPTVGVVDNCDGSSDLTASNFTGSLLWSNGATTSSIHVTSAGTYTVTQTVTGCTGPAGSGTAAPKTTPGAPTVGVVDNCDGSSDLTASNFTGSLLWSNGATTSSIHVTSAGTYTVTQTVTGCTGPAGSGTAAPKTTPGAPTVSYTAPGCDEATFSITISSVTSGATYTVFDKNGNTIPGISPASPYNAPSNANIKFSNIPAGSGYQVSVGINGCPSTASSCVTALNATTPVSNSTNKIANNVNGIETIAAEIGSQTKVLAAPNPYNDIVRFNLTSSVSGQGSLELYNMMGQKMKTLYQGFIEKGRMQKIEFNVPSAQRSNLIYIFRVGNQSVTGKLINLKR